MIVSGWESTVPEILAAETRLRETRQRQLAAALMHRPAHSLAFEHARLFDPQSRHLIPHTTVLIDGERITAVGRDGSIAVPRDTERIDAHDRVMLPGLWDLHAHLGGLSPDKGILLIAAGVTTVRNMAATPGQQRQFEDGKAIGPRQLFVGVLDGHGPNASPSPTA
jgi:hypothetical protein